MAKPKRLTRTVHDSDRFVNASSATSVRRQFEVQIVKSNLALKVFYYLFFERIMIFILGQIGYSETVIFEYFSRNDEILSYQKVDTLCG
jgi:hypothetical protein